MTGCDSWESQAKDTCSALLFLYIIYLSKIISYS